jgi:hypothetical protein
MFFVAAVGWVGDNNDSEAETFHPKPRRGTELKGSGSTAKSPSSARRGFFMSGDMRSSHQALEPGRVPAPGAGAIMMFTVGPPDGAERPRVPTEYKDKEGKNGNHSHDDSDDGSSAATISHTPNCGFCGV